MATRFYIPASAPVAGLSPSFDAGWNFTSEATRHELARAKSNSALTVGTRVGPWTATAGQKALDRQLISPPLDAQTISGTFSAMMSSREYATSDNVDRPMVAVKVINSSGTVVATLLALTTPTGANTTEMSATAQTSCTFANGATLSSYACSAGDRIIVEIGFSNVTAGTTPEASNTYGDPTSGTDATLGNNAATNVTPWIEFSANLTFAAPTLTSVSPSSGNQTGGTVATFTGTGFMPGSTVTVDGNSVTGVTYVSQTSLTGTTPAGGSLGAKTVVVTNTDSLTGSLSSGFTYVPAPAPLGVLGSRCKRFYHGFSNAARTWTDEIGGVNATNAASANTPANASLASGYVVPNFDGNATGSQADFLEAGPISGLATYTTSGFYLWFALLKCDAIGADGESIVMRTNGSGTAQVGITAGGKIYAHGGTGTQVESDASIAGDGITHSVIVMGNAATGALQMWVDGTLQASAGTGSDWGKEWKATGQEIGARNNLTGDYRYDGLMAAMGFAYDASSFSGDIASLHSALVEYDAGGSGGGGGDLSGSVPIGVSFAGVLTGAGSLAGSVPIAITPAGSLSAVGSLAGSIPVAITFAGTLASGASMSGSVPIALTFAGTLTAAGALAGAVPISIAPAGVLSATGALAGAVPIALTPAGALSAVGSLAGSVPIAITPAGTLRAVGALVGSVPIGVAFGGSLTGRGNLVGSVPIALAFAGVISDLGGNSLVGSVPIGVAFSGNLTAVGVLVGSVPIGLALAGTLTGRGSLSGSVPISITPAGTLVGAAPMVGSIPISLSTQGTLTGAGLLAGTIPISVAPAGILTGLGSLAGSIPIAVSPAGVLTGTGALSGAIPVSIVFAFRSFEGEPASPGGFVTVVPVDLRASARTFPTITTAVAVVVTTSAKLGVFK